MFSRLIDWLPLANTTDLPTTIQTDNSIASLLVPSVFAFLIGLIIAPFILKFLLKQQMWRKQKSLKAFGGDKAPITEKLNDDNNLKIPRMGGLVVIKAVIITTLFFWIVSFIDRSGFIHNLNFVSRGETWLVLFALVAGFVIGLLDDLAVCGRLKFLRGKIKEYIGGGLPLKIRLLIASMVGLIGGLWFFFKLERTELFIPFFSNPLEIGWLIIPLMIIVVMATYSGGVIDGVDGLAGGVFATIFTVYGLIALLPSNTGTGSQVDLATFCFVVAGAILAFLWYNIPPAKFYMSETGSMALTITLSIIAFLTNTVLILPIIAFPLVVSSLSVILQVFWKKFFKRKLFLVSPLHNYFRAKGYPAYSVVMRYWIVTQIAAMSGLVIFLLGY